VTAIYGVRLLGPRLASFTGLTEVLFAVLVAWLLLGELPTLMQLGGGALIIAGIAAVRADETRNPAAPARAAAAAGAGAGEPDPAPEPEPAGA
jgi:drug/metabolite transporter (DMT)-like permease